MQPCQNLEFLGVEINSKGVILVLPEEKKEQNSGAVSASLKEDIREFQSWVELIRELSQVIDRLASKATAALPAPLQYHKMQRPQIVQFPMKKN